MRQIVDRIENSRVTLIGPKKKQTVVHLKTLPRGTREGDVLIDGKLSRTDTNQTKKRVGELLSQILGKKKPASGR